MKVIKPGKLSVLTRCFEFGRQFHCGISALAFVPLAEPWAMLSEVALWAFAGNRLGKDTVLDAAIPQDAGRVHRCGICLSSRWGGGPAVRSASAGWNM